MTIWILAVAAAVIFRHVARLTTNLKLSVWLSDGRTAIYFITYIVWGILLRRNVVVRTVKRWLSAIVFLMLFWMIVRTVKFRLPNTSVWGRYLSFLFLSYNYRQFLFHLRFLFLFFVCTHRFTLENQRITDCRYGAFLQQGLVLHFLYL